MATVVAETVAALSIDDARRAAIALAEIGVARVLLHVAVHRRTGPALELAEIGVARVLLHGSVACGDRSRHSDIDLIAIYDLLD